MNCRTLRGRRVPLCAVAAAALIVAIPQHIQALGRGTQRGGAQGGGQAAQGSQAGQSGRAAAPIDLTGYWVSLIVDEWRFRVTPQKGDILYLPLNAEARRIANEWDPDKDVTEGNQCKAYGAVGVTQRPGRLHITWENDNTLRIDADAGTQTRLLRFGQAQAQRGAPSAAAALGTPRRGGDPTWQGYSVAEWQVQGGRRGAQPRGSAGASPAARPGALKVVTTNMKPGYIRKNGVPHSGNALLTEYFQVLAGAQGETYVAVTATVDDPKYLTQPFVRTYMFKKVPDGSGWDPTPCWTR